jgi:hypothetical protein
MAGGERELRIPEAGGQTWTVSRFEDLRTRRRLSGFFSMPWLAPAVCAGTCSSSVNCTVLYPTFFQYGYLDTIGTYRWFSGFRIEEARLRRVPAPCASIAHEERADGAVLCPDGVVIVNRP